MGKEVLKRHQCVGSHLILERTRGMAAQAKVGEECEGQAEGSVSVQAQKSVLLQVSGCSIAATASFVAILLKKGIMR